MSDALPSKEKVSDAELAARLNCLADVAEPEEEWELREAARRLCTKRGSGVTVAREDVALPERVRVPPVPPSSAHEPCALLEDAHGLICGVVGWLNRQVITDAELRAVHAGLRQWLLTYADNEPTGRPTPPPRALQKYILGAHPTKQTAMIRPFDENGNVTGPWREFNAGIVYLADDVDAASGPTKRASPFCCDINATYPGKHRGGCSGSGEEESR